MIIKAKRFILSRHIIDNLILNGMNKQNTPQGSMHEMDILIWQTFKLFFKNKKQILEKLDLTCSQFEILSAMHCLLSISPNIIQINLSERTGIDPMTTSTILRNLQKKGLITRHRSIVNTRAILVELTSDGIELLEKAYQQIKKDSDLIYKDINNRRLASQLIKISDKLNKLNN